MKRIGVIGDLHLGKLALYIPNHLNIQLEFVDTIINKMKSKKLDQIVFLGDVFDKPSPSFEIQVAFFNLIRNHKDVRFHWVCGNHDKTSKKTVAIDLFAQVAPNLTVYLEPTKSGPFGFLPYPHREPLSFINFAHIESPGVRLDSGKLSTVGSEWDSSKNFVIGHIHTPQRVGNANYTGSPFQLSFGERLPKYYGLVEYSKSSFSHRFHKVTPPYFLANKRADSLKELKKLVETARSHPHVFFKLKVGNFRVPNNLLIDNPNIIMLQKDTDTLVLGDRIKDMSNPDFQISPTFMLKEYLEGNGLDKKSVRWALHQVDRMET